MSTAWALLVHVQVRENTLRDRRRPNRPSSRSCSSLGHGDGHSGRLSDKFHDDVFELSKDEATSLALRVGNEPVVESRWFGSDRGRPKLVGGLER